MAKIRVCVIAALMISQCGCSLLMTAGDQRRHPPGRAVGWKGKNHPPGRAVGWHRKHSPQPGLRLVLIEGTGIQFAADSTEDIFLYSGTWYKFQAGAWLSAGSHGGPWISIGAPPPAFGKIPPGHSKAHVKHYKRVSSKKGRAFGAVAKGHGGKTRH